MNPVTAGPSAAGVDDAERLKQWREKFRGHDIFDVIDHAILVAAAQSPQELLRRRDGILEHLYTASANPGPGSASAGHGHGGALHAPENACDDVGAPAQEPKDESTDDQWLLQFAGDAPIDDDSMNWLLAIHDDIVGDVKVINEVHHIKEILLNHQEQSVDTLLESLRRLHQMQLTVAILKSSDIECAVAALSNHRSHEIRELVNNLVKGWKTLVDAKAAMTGDSSESLDKSNPSAAVDERRLAIPPLDKMGLPAQSSADPNLEIGRRKIDLTDIKLETTKRKLQEAEKAKKKRTVQIMELRDIPKPKGVTMKARKPNSRTSLFRKIIDHRRRNMSTAHKNHSAKRWKE